MTAENKTENKGESKPEGEKLYAGKYKTVEDLVEGYKNSLPLHQENETLKKKVEELSSVPADYQKPADITLPDNQWESVKKMAKNSSLTQAQFDKLARETHSLVNEGTQSFERSKKEIGADNLNLLQDYVNKNYPAKVAEKVLANAIVDKEVRDALLAARTAALNSTTPGIGRPNSPGGYAISKDDVLKAREVMMKSNGKAKVEAQENYINLQKQYAHARQAGG
jgi:hypothetical protein